MKKTLYSLFVFLFIFNITTALTLEEAINLAKKNNPQIKQYLHIKESRKYEIKASKGNFIPQLRYNFNYTRYNDNPTDYFDRNHTISLEWNIYNQWNNIYQYNASKINYQIEDQNYKKIELDIIYKVKIAYINAVANYKIKEYRKKQLEMAKIDLDVAKEKFKLGLVKKSDVFNSKVRYEQAKYNYIKAITDYKTALMELNSLIGLPLDKEEKLDEKILDETCLIKLPDYEKLKAYLYENRPELKLAKLKIKLQQETIKREKYSYTPSITIFFKKVKDYISISGENDYNYYGLTLSWTLFSGLRRYNNILSAKEKEISERENYNEIKRQLELTLYKKYLQLTRSFENLQVAKIILEQAELNYNQVFNEYKYGKNDIVALVNAEISLSNARETLVKSLQEIAILKADLERELAIKDLNEITSK